MTIVVAGKKVHDGKGDAFLAAAEDCIAKTRREKGCTVYDLLRSTECPNTFTFYEEWETREDLAAHMQTDHFFAFGKAIDGIVAEDIPIKIFEATPSK